ncbi:hypothetical protein HZS38_07585 [Xenorhabdus nematophila]|uniref:Complete genome segment 8/17 n=1 Tax=Xenorhabdus nematophila (strain ATCC 19061 / DSM 3370 / CCUG 14189 / LMG 1036 / NCIMB 9965 / AN6) TaxID=406817 RepID=D3VEP4_XENNA|nr:hypothetical protein [Xenorhabdus nematophila]CEE93714.1 conserved hypothetical protein [Xenorhabdus nematophila str. Anatoliense]CEF30351.1 conserved hypothetical protein [Xenorhabdus nematophila str. Websteri]AYA40348.1 hypothetical protein D3790_07675 [Xenorhabdus nematophila]MBA0019021.1 hypothetical protein [Xenorhabdus nematophila]MCB4424360.1 hypothetical protein [Xenorhabdus nematophila]
MPLHLENIDKIAADFTHLNESKRNSALYDALEPLAYEIVKDVDELILSPGYRFIRIDNRLDLNKTHFELALLCDITHEVVYYNKVIITNDVELNCRPVSQVLLWRTKKPQHNAVLNGLASKIFFHYLIKSYDVIISDVNQTTEGMSFWQGRMYEALLYGLYVYGYDVMSGEVRRISNQDEVGDYQSWLWGNKDHHPHRLAVISTIILPNK